MKEAAALQTLFGRLPPIDCAFEQYFDRGKCLKIFQNERICFDQESQENLGVFYVQTGLLKLSARRPYHDATLNFCFYGEKTLLERRVSKALFGRGEIYVEACENTVAYGYTHEAFFEILRQDETLFQQYTQLHSAQMSLQFQRMELTACLDAGQRVVGWLVELCRQVCADEAGEHFIPCRLTQQEIADYLLIHVTTFNRVFSELKKECLVEKNRNGFLIHDFERLQALQERMGV